MMSIISFPAQNASRLSAGIEGIGINTARAYAIRKCKPAPHEATSSKQCCIHDRKYWIYGRSTPSDGNGDGISMVL
jgi:hypothetical protein